MSIVYDVIPDRWFLVGQCKRQTTLLHSDGSRSPHQGVEHFLTFKLPWKRRMYSISTDDFIRAHPRFVMRFRCGWCV